MKLFKVLLLSSFIGFSASGCRAERGDSTGTEGEAEIQASSRRTADAVVGASKASDLPATVRAFLDAIAFAEGTHGSYNMMYGGKTFSSFSDHPRVWRASPWGTPGVGSDAAGRYQFKSTSWDEARQKLGLKDFSPVSQDRAAVYLMQRKGAYAYENVKNAQDRNRFNAATSSLSYVWASLPPQRYKGQKVRTNDELWVVFQKAHERYK
jgi:muramidase (phage lysozyme)